MSLSECQNCLDSFNNKSEFNILIHIENNPPGTKVEFRITNIKEYGMFGVFGENLEGIVFKESFDPELVELFEIGDCILTEVTEYSKRHKRFQLKYIDLL